MDLIVSWPKSADYPTWRDFICVHRSYFEQVIVVFTETNQGYDYRTFVQEVMKDDHITFLQAPYPTRPDDDWRNLAVNAALDVSTAHWVWFTEQDFFVLDNLFWAVLAKLMLTNDVVGYQDGATRLHPACLFAKRSVIDKTERDFGIIPDKLDHFAKFYTQLRLRAQAKIAKLPNGIWSHMNGLSHNLTLLEADQPITYEADNFRYWLKVCLNSEIELNDHFRELVLTRYPGIDHEEL